MIGILDSGVGGLSIYRSIKNRLPGAKVIYLADKGNFPYGEKSEDTLSIIVQDAIQTLLDTGANIVVLACNSATVSAVTKMREHFNTPIIGIEPAIKLAAAESKTKKIGVIATQRTTNDHQSEDLAGGCDVFKSHNGGLVAKIENEYGIISDEDLRDAMKPFLDKEIDSVVLGCTHYHFIKERLEKLYPDVKFFSPEEAVTNRLLAVMNEENIGLETGDDIFLVTAGKENFEKLLKEMVGVENADVREI